VLTIAARVRHTISSGTISRSDHAPEYTLATFKVHGDRVRSYVRSSIGLEKSKSCWTPHTRFPECAAIWHSQAHAARGKGTHPGQFRPPTRFAAYTRREYVERTCAKCRSPRTRTSCCSSAITIRIWPMEKTLTIVHEEAGTSFPDRDQDHERSWPRTGTRESSTASICLRTWRSSSWSVTTR